eukprot:1847217-Heterocapsa_arctica.AAC.1
MGVLGPGSPRRRFRRSRGGVTGGRLNLRMQWGGTPNLQYGVQLDEQGRCPMHRVQLPAAPHWST